MKVLLAIAHYYRGEENPIHASTSKHARGERAAGIRQAIETWRGHLDETSVLHVAQRRYQRIESSDSLDIAVLIRGADHLLDREYCQIHRVRPIQVLVDDPRMIPFAAHKLFADARDDYDLFVYSEDDLRPSDSSILTKIAGFVETFGPKRLVMPNRYEWNEMGPTRKTFIDGDLRPELTSLFFERIPDEPVLIHRFPGRDITFRRALNPHSGFFALTRDQLLFWVQQPHFLDHDCSFVRPLESAATLSMLKTFAIYKGVGRDMGWIEIEHLDKRYSSLGLQRALDPDA